MGLDCQRFMDSAVNSFNIAQSYAVNFKLTADWVRVTFLITTTEDMNEHTTINGN